MANRINYTDKVALNARTEIADINKHTAADDNEIKNVVNAHATNIETLEANQTSGVIRADTIVDEGDGRSFLPVSGDTSTAYIVDGEVAPNEVKNGNYEWDGAAYTKTAYQTVAGSKTDLATNGSQDVFTSQGAFNLDANLQGQIDSNDTEIAQNISDIAQNTLDITQNESDIAENQTRSTDTENILLVGSDAYTHAERGVSDGFTTERLVQLDNEIEANLGADFYFKAGHSKGAGKIGIAVPDVSAADLSISRNSIATFTNKRGLIETALANVPRFDWSSGEPALLTEPQAENLIEYSNDFTEWEKVGNLPTITPNQFNDLTGKNDATRYYNPVSLGGLRLDCVGNNGILSVYVKGLQGQRFKLELEGGGSIIHDFNGEWERISHIATGAYTRCSINNYTSASDGEVDFLIYQCDVIEGSNVTTSPIPTNGATVVRLADTDIETGDISQYIDSSNMKITFEVSFLNNNTADSLVGLTDSTGENYILLGNESVSSGENRVRLIIRSNNLTVVNEVVQLGMIDISDKNTYTVDINNSVNYVFKIENTNLSSGVMSNSPIGLKNFNLYLPSNSFVFKGNIFKLKIS
jgi:hypothetical protein